MKTNVLAVFTDETPPDLIADCGRWAEERGLNGIWAPEHVLFFPDYASRYPYAEDGRLPGDPTGWYDPFMALTWIAAATTTIRLGTGVCLVAQRNPVYTAKYVADLDVLSGGRVDFGVGIGWLKEEFEALGVPFARRGARTVESLDLMRTLWTEDRPAYRGEHFSLPECHFNPKPLQKPHPPIYFGGNADLALERAAKHADGWYGFGLSPQEFAQKKARIEAAAAEAGRDGTALRFLISPPLGGLVDSDAFARYAEAGANEITFAVPVVDAEEVKRALDQFAAAGNA